MKLKRWVNPATGAAGYNYWCQGCNDVHGVQTEGPASSRFGGCVWGFNGSLEAPTFTPSVVTNSGHFCYAEPQETCWCTYNAAQIAKGEEPSSFTCYHCHTFIRDGRVEFLSDCSHALRGLHDLPDWPRGDGP